MKQAIRRAHHTLKFLIPWCRRRRSCDSAMLSVLLMMSLICMLWLLSMLGDPEPPARPSDSPLRHLPLKYWEHLRMYPHRYQWSQCIRPPHPKQILHDSTFWQRVAPLPEEISPPIDPLGVELEDFEIPVPKALEPNSSQPEPSSSDMLVYSAYWDDSGATPMVTVIVHSEKVLPPLYCQLWYYNKGYPVAVVAQEVTGPAVKVGVPVGSRVVRCVARAGDAPPAVSVTGKRCARPYTMLQVQGAPIPSSSLGWLERPEPQRRHRTGLAVCTKWPPHDHIASVVSSVSRAVLLAEWLLALQATNITTVYVYTSQSSTEELRVLETLSFPHHTLVEVTPYMGPRGQVGAGLGVDDVTPLLDCVLRARTHHAWVAMLTVQHLPITYTHESWSSLLSSVGPNADVVQLRRYWFAEWLRKDSDSNPMPGPTGISLKPPVKSGRIFNYLWRLPEPVAQDAVYGQFYRTSSVVSFTSDGAVCRGGGGGGTACTQVVAGGGALLSYSERCGAHSRAVCRTFRSSAMYDASATRLRSAVSAALARLQKRKNHYNMQYKRARN